LLFDYADERNHADRFDTRIDLPEELRKDLRAAGRDYYDVTAFTHLDKDHCGGSEEFFWLEHARKYQGEGRIRINELWVPAAALLEDGCQDSARTIRQEARHRFKERKGIRVFSRPDQLKKWVEDNGMSWEAHKHLITDAGQYVPGWSKSGPERVEFFVHSPFGWRLNENEVIDRNGDSLVMQATFLEGDRETYALFMSDIDYEAISQIVDTTKRHRRDDRLLWDVFKIPHHCSYRSLNETKGDDVTVPVPQVKWLCEDRGRDRHIMISTSESIPEKGTPEDEDVQPPHREAADYYKQVAAAKDGQFKVTMDVPNKAKPRPCKIEITERGARFLIISATAGAASIVSTPARAG
jgi:hypothetical protein